MKKFTQLEYLAYYTIADLLIIYIQLSQEETMETKDTTHLLLKNWNDLQAYTYTTCYCPNENTRPKDNLEGKIEGPHVGKWTSEKNT